MERDNDSKMESSRPSAHHPPIVIHLNTFFTNFGRDNRGASGGLLAIVRGHDIAFIEKAGRFARINRGVSFRVLHVRAGDGTRLDFMVARLEDKSWRAR
jgi:hypothetical protein